MTKTFKNLIENLIKTIDETNEEMIKNMINSEYNFACVKENVKYEIYYKILSNKWNKIIDELLSEKDNCTTISELYYAEKLSKQINLTNEKINNIKSDFVKFFNESYKDNENTNLIFDALTDLVMADDIYMDSNMLTTLINLGNLIKTRSVCWLWDVIILCASSKIKAEFPTYNKNSLEDKKQVNLMLRSYFNQIKSMLQILNKDVMDDFFNKILGATSYNLTKSYEMSNVNTSFIENELNTMIPDTIGPLKCFFVDLIQYYYSTDVLHPIIWAQILRDMFVNFLKNPPMSQTELFQFFSKSLLLNSGPFILKILQQVRPIMSEAQRKTYNLTKLTYPKMTESQSNLILNKIIKNWDLYQVINEASASVGHVFFVQHSITLEKFVVKVVKPMSIIQSCYEYSKLKTFFDTNTLEQRFVHNMLFSTGKELQSKVEIEHINRGHKLYTMNYKELYNDIDVNVFLTTITVKENVIIDNCWFALTMSIASGIPLSKLFENNEKNNLSIDTNYRAYLHRSFDLLVYKFFSNIIIHGFYHGDLHSGNVYFSFTDGPERKAQMTLIDFGAVGTIDLFNDDPDINELVKIIIQSTFYNYDNLFDTLTDLLNKKSINSITIDKKSDSYKNFKNELKKIKVTNIYNHNKNPNIIDVYTKSCLNSTERVNNEKSFHSNHTKNVNIEENTQHAKCYYSNNNNSSTNVSKQDDTMKTSIDSLYDLVDIHKIINKNIKTTDDYIETLPAFDCNVGVSTDEISFTEVMNKMMEFYTKSNVNIPITIPDLYELFKAYILINGLSTQMKYDPLRMSIIIGKILYDYENIKNIVKHPAIVLKMYNVYNIENNNYNKLLEKIKSIQ